MKTKIRDRTNISKVLKDKDTVGENGIQGEFPVVPSTQLPQLSIQAVPFGVLLQSTGKLVVVNVVSRFKQEEEGEFPLEHIDLSPFIISLANMPNRS